MRPALLWVCVLTVATACDGGRHPIVTIDAIQPIDSPSGDTATPCTVGQQCTSGVCIPLSAGGGTCAGACPGTTEPAGVCAHGDSPCLPGWAAWQDPSGGPYYCLCNINDTSDPCNHVDDDCDGFVDQDGDAQCTAADPDERCENGQCVVCTARCNSVCTDTSLDLANCGGCNTTCGTPTPTSDPSCSDVGCKTMSIISPTRGRLFEPSVDATRVYYVDGATQQILSCPLVGCVGAPTVVATNIGYPNTVTVAGGYVYWSAEQQLKRCPVAGCGAAHELVGQLALGYYREHVVVGPTIYVLDQGTAAGNGRILSCPIAGCGAGPTILAANLKNPTHLAVDTIRLYFNAEDDGNIAGPDGGIYSCPIAGCAGAPMTIIGSHFVGDLVLAGNRVAFVGDSGGTGWQLMTCPLTGCTGAATIVVPDRVYADELLADGSSIVWTTTDQGGLLESCSVFGCASATILGTNIRAVSGVTFDATAYYMTSDDANGSPYTDGKLHKLGR